MMRCEWEILGLVSGYWPKDESFEPRGVREGWDSMLMHLHLRWAPASKCRLSPKVPPHFFDNLLARWHKERKPRSARCFLFPDAMTQI